MAHYAFLDDNNVVTEVITGVDENELLDGKTPEEWYAEFRGQRCIRTSYNARIRKNYAGIGYIYDEDADAFIAPRPYPSWKLDYETCKWVAPVPIPEELAVTLPKGYKWIWSEINTEWVKIQRPTEV